MNKRFCWAALSLLLIVAWVPGVAQSGANAQKGARDRLIGAWRLAWMEEQGADGKMARLERKGTLLYTSDGHMSVQIMQPDEKPQTLGGPVKYEQNGYEAYYGTYQIDEHAQTVTHHVEGALVRTLIGNDLTRVYQFPGKQLVLKSSRPDEHWAIGWEHY